MPESSGALGIFGGTFDPPHIAHLRLAIEAREALHLTGVVFVPAGSPPLRGSPQASPAQRLAMVERAIADMPDCSVDASEVMASGPSYTVATLERLRAQHGAARPLVLLMGADAFARLPAWQCWRDLFALAHIGVATRPGHTLLPQKVPEGDPKVVQSKQRAGDGDTAAIPLEAELAAEFSRRQGTATDIAHAPAGRIVPFAITPLEISATLIRQRLAQGLSVRHLVSVPVLDYIDSQTIYRTFHGH
ncbi:MAG: nicotinate (nicotinamide) nucleotide adenylyltransferase [Rugosibacter sp.]